MLVNAIADTAITASAEFRAVNFTKGTPIERLSVEPAYSQTTSRGYDLNHIDGGLCRTILLADRVMTPSFARAARVR